MKMVKARTGNGLLNMSFFPPFVLGWCHRNISLRMVLYFKSLTSLIYTKFLNDVEFYQYILLCLDQNIELLMLDYIYNIMFLHHLNVYC